MSASTKIEWTETTWNPTRGCSLVSDGCRNCYAMKQAHRQSGPGRAYEGLTRLGGWNRAAFSSLLGFSRPGVVIINSRPHYMASVGAWLNE